MRDDEDFCMALGNICKQTVIKFDDANSMTHVASKLRKTSRRISFIKFYYGFHIIFVKFRTICSSERMVDCLKAVEDLFKKMIAKTILNVSF